MALNSMNTQIIQAKLDDAPQVRELFSEYLQWANSELYKVYAVKFDIDETITTDMLHLDMFMPSRGRLLLCHVDGSLAGIACLRENNVHTGEVKRMYVRPGFRRQGIGKALLNRLIGEARLIGYERLWLDSARFMSDAHRLYRLMGFHEISAYEGSEIPKAYQDKWIFMEKLIP